MSSFSIGNGGAATVPLTGLELNLYALSSAWLRAGLSAAAGRGHGIISGAGTTAGIDTAVRYGMLGVTAAFQVPTRFSPFIAGSLAGGVLAGSTDGALSIPGTSVSLSGGSGATWIYTRGIDVGAQLYTFGSLHLTGSVGWVRATWRGLDTVAMSASASANPSAGIRFKSVGNDSVAIKLGLGF